MAALLLLLAYLFIPDGNNGELDAALGNTTGDTPANGITASADGPTTKTERAESEPSAVDAVADSSVAVNDEEEQFFLSGKVMDEGGNPVEGAWVTTAKDPQPVFTDASGHFATPIAAPPGPGNWLIYDAWHEGYELARSQTNEPGAVTIVLKKGTTFPARVIDATNQQPIEGAVAQFMLRGYMDPALGALNQYPWIKIPIPPFTSDANGIFTVPPISSGFIHITAPGYADSVEVVYPSPHEWNFALVPKAQVRVRFVLEDDTPLANTVASFDPSFEPITTDGDGWLTVPALSQAYYSNLVLQWQDKGYVFGWAHDLPQLPKLENGKELVVPYRPIEGKLAISGSAKPEEFEVATFSLRWNHGTYKMPDPDRQPELLYWAPVNSDASFEILNGWQGAGTEIAVRRIADGEIIHKQRLKGEGPFLIPLDLDYGALARFEIKAEPPEALHAMRLWIYREYQSNPDQKVPALPLKDGKAEVNLRQGQWAVKLIGEGFESSPRLGSISMAEGETDFVFDLGKLRKVRGRLTAGGRAVDDAILDFHQKGGYYVDRRSAGPRMGDSKQLSGFMIRKRLTGDGKWDIGWIPETAMIARFETDNRWLGRGASFHFELPPGQDYFDFKLPVATVKFTLNGDVAPAPKDVEIWRKELPELGGVGVDYMSTYHHAFPDLSAGPQEITVSPGQFRLFLHDPTLLLTPTNFTVREGEYLPLTVQVEPAGEVVVVWHTEQGPWQARYVLEPAEEGLMSVEPRRIISREYNARKGGFRYSYSTVPGKWKLRLTDVSKELDSKHMHETGNTFGNENNLPEIELEVVGGRRTFVIVGLDADGNLTLRQELRDRE